MLKPTFGSFNCISFRAKPLYASYFSCFRLTSFKKLRTSSISLSYRTPFHSNDPKRNWVSSGVPLNPLSVWVSVIRSIKGLIFSRTSKWVPFLQAYRDAEKVFDDSNGTYLQSNGLGIALLSVTSNAKVKISPFVAQLAANPTFVSGLVAWFLAQTIKILLNFFVERKWDLRILFSSGGMPSSHSALCTALTTSVALCHGVADSLFPVCLGFSLIVMYDAIGVRRHAGMQAEVGTRYAFLFLFMLLI